LRENESVQDYAKRGFIDGEFTHGKRERSRKRILSRGMDKTGGGGGG